MPTNFELWMEVIASPKFLGVLCLAAVAVMVLFWDWSRCPEDPIERILENKNRKV